MVEILLSIFHFSQGRLIWIEWAFILGALGLLTFTSNLSPFIITSLFLLIASFVIRFFRTKNFLPKTGLEIPWFLFITSASFAVWIAYDREAAFLQFSRILATLVIFYATCDSTSNHQKYISKGMLLAASVITIYWLIQFASVTLLSEFSISQTLPSIHPNVLAGFLACILPFGLINTWDIIQSRYKARAFLSIIATLIIVSGLFITHSRGVWISLLVTTLIVFLVMAWKKNFTDYFFLNAHWIVIGALLLISLGLISTGKIDSIFSSTASESKITLSRPTLWIQGYYLIQDYFFTGSGLMTFPLVHANYSILTHIPYTAHVHNTYLQVWLEQGFVSAIALIWAGVIFIKWMLRAITGKGVPKLAWAGLVGLLILTVHGFMDVVFYIEPTLPLIGIIAGFAWLSNKGSLKEYTYNLSSKTYRNLILYNSLVLLFISLSLHRIIISTFYANLASINQTFRELSIYNPKTFDNPTMDQIRRSIDLQDSIIFYSKALIWQNSNRTALQRTGQISLSTGGYDKAEDAIATAWNQGHHDNTIRLLYGDVLVSQGQPEHAAIIIQGIPWSEERLMGQAWYRYWLNQDYLRAAYAWQAILYLNSSNMPAQYWLKQAQIRFSNK